MLMISSENLSARLWADIEHIYRAVLTHPFLTGLTDGTLAIEAFRHFIVQDAHYPMALL
jgi:thiaminase (transcriptional activator TenA)